MAIECAYPPERGRLVHQVVSELRELRDHPFQPAADVDIVWVISQPGTALSPSRDGIYAGASTDRKVIDFGISLISKITALRLKKELQDVTHDDIKTFGPTLFYNGEDQETEGFMYTQNEDFKKLSRSPNFPIPGDKIVIQHIPRLGTHTQVQEFARYLKELGGARKVAVVSMGTHSPRVGRYLRRYLDLFPEGIKFINAAVEETDKPVGKLRREIRKIVQYAKTGDLSEEAIEGF